MRRAMHRTAGGILSDRQRKNFEILETVRRRAPISRTEISRITGFNIVTVSNYVANYIKKGLIVEKGLDVSSGGRKPELIDLNADMGYIIGLDVGDSYSSETNLVGLIMNLSGKVIAREKKLYHKENVEDMFKELVQFVKDMVSKYELSIEKIQGIGIGMTGGTSVLSTTFKDISSRGIVGSYGSLHDLMEEEFGVPTVCSNNATVAALGEKMLGLGQEVNNMLYMHSDVGCGIIINGQIYSGASGNAGEIGINIREEDEFDYWARGLSYLRPEGADLGIVNQARKILDEGIASKISEIVDNKLENITNSIIIKAAKEGDAVARDLIENAGVGLGIRIAYLINLFNPEMVIIGGGMEEAGTLILEPVKRTIRKRSFDKGNEVKILPTQLGENVVALGSASVMLRDMFINA